MSLSLTFEIPMMSRRRSNICSAFARGLGNRYESSCVVSRKPGELTGKIANKEPQTLEHLLRIIDGYARGKEDSKRRQAIQAEYDKASIAAAQAQVQAQHGNAQDPRPQQGAAVEAPHEAAQEQAPPAEQCHDVQRKVIQVITRADPPVQQSKRQKKMQLRTVHNITAAGDRAPRYLNQQISFGPEDAEGVLFPHQDPLVISAEVAGFEVRRILVDGGSSADVIFAEAYAKMGLPTLALTQAPASLRGFGGEAVQVLGQVQLVVAFGTSENRRKEQILFDAVDIPYNYNAIFCRTTLNKFDAISHHNYLKLKMPARPSWQGDQDADRRRRSHKACLAGGDLGKEEAENILEVLKKNIDIFAWSPDEVGGVLTDLIMHHLAVKPDDKPRKQ
uniref:Retrotransposon protein, putative, Ty3-gypsy subclass n=1 Tax=Oryza sativa subsp. japonica TaxID=39947 RepID=Q2QUU2_ORYSJ|nr:retrotransposon protein, putative, Ty3-gypsy subclass [Oryza sativa Japonica Group]